jgi:hypothetical protein
LAGVQTVPKRGSLVPLVNPETTLNPFNFYNQSFIMNRRAYLKGAGVGLTMLGGCLSSASPSEQEQNKMRRRVEIEEVGSVPKETGIEYSLEMVEEIIDENSTAILRATMRNVGSDTQQFQLPFYKGASSYAGRFGILLYSLTAVDSPPRDYAPECFDSDYPKPERTEVGWSTERPPKIELGSGEMHKNELIVVDDFTSQGCFPTGKYEFRSPHSVRGIDFAWSFSIRIEDVS